MRFKGLLLSMLVLSAPFSALEAKDAGCEQEKCVAIVDAGSTGSRVHVYSYDLDPNNSPIHITERASRKIKPGLAVLDANQETVNAYLNGLFSDTKANQWPVYIYATAGMRLLSTPKQAQIYGLVQNWFNNQSDWILSQARTISGSEEGVFGWLAVNDQLGTLQDDKASVGVMDMGGASVQVTFPVQHDRNIPKKNLREISIYGQKKLLFVKSFLGLGQNELAHQFLDSKNCFISEYEMPNAKVGKGDVYNCTHKVSKLINDVHHVDHSVKPALKHNPVEQWFVLGGLDYLVKSEPFKFQGNFFTSANLLQKAQTDICQQPWPTLSAKFPKDDFLYGYCLFPAYYYALMIHGYGINAQKNISYLGADKSVEWTRGVVLSLNQKDVLNDAMNEEQTIQQG